MYYLVDGTVFHKGKAISPSNQFVQISFTCGSCYAVHANGTVWQTFAPGSPLFQIISISNAVRVITESPYRVIVITSSDEIIYVNSLSIRTNIVGSGLKAFESCSEDTCLNVKGHVYVRQGCLRGHNSVSGPTMVSTMSAWPYVYGLCVGGKIWLLNDRTWEDTGVEEVVRMYNNAIQKTDGSIWVYFNKKFYPTKVVCHNLYHAIWDGYEPTKGKLYLSRNDYTTSKLTLSLQDEQYKCVRTKPY